MFDFFVHLFLKGVSAGFIFFGILILVTIGFSVLISVEETISCWLAKQLKQRRHRPHSKITEQEEATLIARLTERDKSFSEAALKQHAYDCLIQFQDALVQENEHLQPMIQDEYDNRNPNTDVIEDYREHQWKYGVTDRTLLDSQFSKLRKKKRKADNRQYLVLSVTMDVSLVEQVKDSKGNVIAGNAQAPVHKTYTLHFMRPLDAKTQGSLVKESAQCPHCQSPISTNLNRYCSDCYQEQSLNPEQWVLTTDTFVLDLAPTVQD